MFRSKAFSARPVYFLSIVKSRSEIAMDLCHGKKHAYIVAKGLDPWAESVINEVKIGKEE
jgi:hypothetical protein